MIELTDTQASFLQLGHAFKKINFHHGTNGSHNIVADQVFAQRLKLFFQNIFGFFEIDAPGAGDFDGQAIGFHLIGEAALDLDIQFIHGIKNIIQPVKARIR
jgi:hypothetical protein